MRRDDGASVLWSRGEELVTDAFPELVAAAQALPAGTVIDGEILAWSDDADAPLPFARLQQRLNRKAPGAKLLRDVPVVFLAYDLLEHEGDDVARAAACRAPLAQLDALLPQSRRRCGCRRRWPLRDWPEARGVARGVARAAPKG